MTRSADRAPERLKGERDQCEALRLPQKGRWRRCTADAEYDLPNGRRVCWLHRTAVRNRRAGPEPVLFCLKPDG